MDAIGCGHRFTPHQLKLWMTGRIPSLEEVTIKWDEFAPIFQKYQQKQSRALAFTMACTMEFEKATVGILEVGGGAGGAAKAILSAGLVAPDVPFVHSDLSPKMVELAQEDLNQLARPMTQSLVANGQALPFEDAKFDRVFGVLCLQLTPDPDAMLRDSLRVLTPGGYAGWAVWGARDKSPMFDLRDRVMSEVVGPPSGGGAVTQGSQPVRTNFHLNEEDKLRTMGLAAGYRDVVFYRQPMIMECWSGASYAHFIINAQPETRRTVEGLSPEKQQAFVQALTTYSQELLDSGIPIGMEALVVLMRK